MPWPIGTSFGEASGKEPSYGLMMRVERRSAIRSLRLRRQCENQSTTGIRSGRANGAARMA